MESDQLLTRPDCGLCRVPVGSAGCLHAWINDGEVTMAVDQWHKIIDTADRFRRAVIRLDEAGYEAGEYDA